MEKTVMDETVLPQHPTLLDPRTGEPLRALGIVGGRVVWPMMGGSEDADGGGDEGATDEGETENEEGTDEESRTEKSKQGKASDETVPLSKFKKLEGHLRAADRKKAEIEAELKQLRDKDLPEADKLKRDHEEAVQRAESAENKFSGLARKYSFLLATQEAKITWRNPATALKVAELDNLEISEDGTVEGIAEAVAALAKDHPYLVHVAETTDDEDGEGKLDKKSKPRSGNPVGSKQRGKAPEGQLSDEQLKKRFPALR